MAAMIIPFARPTPKDLPTVPPPMVTGFCENDFLVIIGTKEQLVAWGAAEDRHFPVKPKRAAYNGGGEPTVRALKGGLFQVCRHARRSDLGEAARVTSIGRRILSGSSEANRKTLAMLNMVLAWRKDMIFSRLDGYDAGLLDPLDAALDAFRDAACAMVMYRAEPEVVAMPARTPPDALEPEHAQ